MAKSMKPGGGGRFQALKQKLMKQGKTAESAEKIAAWIGRKKYGAAQMAKWSAKSRKKS